MKRSLLPVILIFLTACWDIKEAVFIIPDGFMGYVIVLHDQSDGEIANAHDGQEIYTITHSGILRTQVGSNEDWQAEPKFYWKEVHPLNEIERIDVNDLGLERKVYGFGHGSIFIDGKQQPIAYTQFFVSTSDEVDSLTKAFENLDLVSLVHGN